MTLIYLPSNNGEEVSDILPSDYRVVTRSRIRISRVSQDQTINKYDYITHKYNKVFNTINKINSNIVSI